MGKLIVIEGLDGSGKATQTALLEERCRAEGLPVRRVSFPDYGSDSSAPAFDIDIDGITIIDG